MAPLPGLRPSLGSGAVPSEEVPSGFAGVMASLLCHWSVGTLAVGPLNPGIITLTSSIKTSEQGKGSKNTQDLRSVLKKAGAFLEIEEMDTLKMAGKHILEGIVGSPLLLPAWGRRGGWNGWRRAHRGSEI